MAKNGAHKKIYIISINDCLLIGLSGKWSAIKAVPMLADARLKARPIYTTGKKKWKLT